MAIRDIFVPLCQQIDFDPPLEAAARLAERLNAGVDVVFMRPEPITTAVALPDMLVAAGVVLEAIEKESVTAEASAMSRFRTWHAAYGDIDARWHDRVGPIANTIREVGRLTDLIVMGRCDPDEPETEEMLNAALFSTGRPTVIVPGISARDPLDHILIAWNGSLEAARAVDAALPMLTIAKRVSIFTAPENSKELERELGLIAHLSHHGIHAVNVTPASWSTDVGLRLTETAANENASMIVMGAYTHHRIRQAFLGGVTRHVLKDAEIPALMMH